jgi:hypothetical protein
VNELAPASNMHMVLAFCAVAVVLLSMISYMLYRRALEMGHHPGGVRLRLVIFWLGCAGALAIGVYFHRLYPQGLFSVNFSGGSAPVTLVGGTQAQAPLLVALAGMVLCALIAWLAVRPLQVPPADLSEEKPE